MFIHNKQSRGFALMPILGVLAFLGIILFFSLQPKPNTTSTVPNSTETSLTPTLLPITKTRTLTPQIIYTTPKPTPYPTPVQTPVVDDSFLLKSQCAQLGRAFQDKEDSENKNHDVLYLTREFGYSKNINSCYFSEETSDLSLLVKKGVEAGGGKVWDLLTNNLLLSYVSFNESIEIRLQKQSDFYKQRFILLGQ